ncbi:MAG: hypothetical protein EBZ48_16090 [Proteobacteria bacterium]|nr:hypothetical protein [Pseudomonadota bacterium]
MSSGGTGQQPSECPPTDAATLCKITPEVMQSFYDTCNPWSDYTLWGAVPVVGQQRQAAISSQSPLARLTGALRAAQACLESESSQLDTILATQEIALRASLNNLIGSIRSIVDVAVENSFQPLRYTQYMLGMYAGALGLLLMLVVFAYN